MGPEARIEQYLVKRIQLNNGECEKFVSPMRRSVPDRVITLPIPEEHREIVARYIKFVECKAPGKHATEMQERDHQRRREMGFDVRVIDSKEGVDVLVKELS